MTRTISLAAALLLSTAGLAAADPASFSAIFGGKVVGHLVATPKGAVTTIDFDIKNNGRGPTIAETIRSGPDGLPVDWTVTGATTFGSKVSEHFHQGAGKASWSDSTGKGEARITAPGLYVTQAGSPWAAGIYARALLKAPGMTLSTLPGGALKLEKGEAIPVTGEGGPITVTRYTLSGIDLTPESLLLDEKGELFASVSASSIIVRKGYEGEQVRLRGMAAAWDKQRFIDIEKDVAHRYGAPVRIRNVRIFDPKTSALTAPVSVVVNGRTIAAVEPVDSPATPGEMTIDGACLLYTSDAADE